MLRVVYVIEHLHMGGEETLLVSLVKELQSTLPQFSTQIIVTLKGGGSLLKTAQNEGLFVINLESTSKWKLLFRLHKEMNKIKPNIIHTRLSSAGYWGRFAAFFLLSRPRILHGHGGNTFHNCGIKRIIFEKILNLITHKHICVSHSVKKHLLDHGFNEKRLIVIENGISSNIPKRSSSMPADTFKFVCVGRLEKVKGHDVLLHALQKVKDDTQYSFSLDVIGKGSQFNVLKALIEDLDLGKEVNLVGELEKPYNRFHKYDAFILPSRSEGLSLSLLEAMAAAIPVIATDTGDTKRVLLEHGLIVPPDSSKELASAIKYFLETPQEIINRAQRTPKIIDDYGIFQTAKKYTELYTNL